MSFIMIFDNKFNRLGGVRNKGMEMSEVRVGSWIVDLEARTVSEGDLVVSIIPEKDGTFSILYSGDVSLERQIEVRGEALEVFKRAKIVATWLSQR